MMVDERGLFPIEISIDHPYPCQSEGHRCICNSFLDYTLNDLVAKRAEGAMNIRQVRELVTSEGEGEGEMWVQVQSWVAAAAPIQVD